MGKTSQAVADLTRERWETNAKYWTKIIRERRDRYRTELTDAAILEAIGSCAGRKVLDAGCGEGYLARTLAGQGADVVGVDVSGGLIGVAGRCPADGTGSVSYAHASVEALPVRDNVFDLVVGNHLFSHLPDPRWAVREFGRVLKRGGRLIFLTLHPCFYTAGSERGATGSLPAERYFASRGVDQRFLVDGLESPAMITSWLRPLEDYFAALRDAGFVVTDLREPHPAAERYAKDPWWRTAFPTAMFLLLVAERR